MNTENEITAKDKTLLTAMGIVMFAVIVLAIIGFLFMKPEAEYCQGQADASAVRISGKMPGRIAEIFVTQGQRVNKGDTLVRIHSSLVDAQLLQAESMEQAAESQSRKADAGARTQVVTAAYNLWQQALAAEKIAKKTSQRLENLYAKGVVSEQKRDEAKAKADASSAAAAAAKSQYDMALEGAQKEDKAAAASMAAAARGGVKQVEAILEDSYLVAPCDGEISDIYPEVSELVGPGAPIMSILKVDDMWISFNVREQMLENLTMGKEVEVMIPALGEKIVKAKIYYIHDMGAYAVWRATKATGEYDSRTFEVKMRPVEAVENLRPGMSVILDK